MSLVYNLFLFGNIFFIFISLINAVLLDIPCTNATQCGGTGAICRGTCQCDTPWFTPCNMTICDPQIAFVYEGDSCRWDINCRENAICDSMEEKCRCKPGFTAINGLCYKSLNSLCTNSTECWSRACRDGICQCRLGFKPKGDNNRCQRVLAKIYPDWISANTSGDFCYDTDSNSCQVPFAVCQNDSQHSEKFCQCPSTYTANYATQQCELTIYNGALSPTDTPSSSNNGCGKCQVENAICVTVSNETKCWCRAGYMKNNNQCAKNQMKLVFPNDYDINQHNYALPKCTINGDNGTIKANNGLCTCASGFKYVDRTSPCQPIKPVWQGDNLEYGVCTRINSNGYSVQENGLCPAPLQCEARNDKHVCSCGRDKYLDEKTNTCYYFLDKNLTNPTNNNCPPNAILNENKCQCSTNGIYVESSDKKQCELKLKLVENSVCSTLNSTSNTICEKLYGGYAQFCQPGQCQCLSNSSYFYNNTCVTLIYIDPGTNGKCPTNSQNNTGTCLCNPGYQADNLNRTCVQKVLQLSETINTSLPLDTSLTNEDCESLFPRQSVIASNSTKECLCDENTFLKDNICYFFLNSTIDQSDSSKIRCPKNAFVNASICQCQSGYKYKNDRECEPFTNKLYEFGTAPNNITGIRTEDCQALFGNASKATENDGYCTCRNETAFFSNDKCYFFVETPQSVDIDHSSCPPNSQKNGNMCKCPVGYIADASYKGCVRKTIDSTNLQAIDINTNVITCNQTYNDLYCESLHGIGAVCRNDICYCDQSRSFVRNNQCVLYSNYVFPGLHERHLYTCDSNNDCGNGVENNGIECGFNNNDPNYKVCKCKMDYLYNANDGTCVKNQCNPRCSDVEDCLHNQCICKVGYYRNSSGQCVKFDTSTKLYDNCDYTIWSALRSIDKEFRCSPRCERVECNSGYHDDGSTCIKNHFSDRCAHNQNLCSELSHDSTCNLDENRCTCITGYYQEDNKCVLPVNARCITDEECGVNKKCIGQLCACDKGKKAENKQDDYGRILQRCIDANGVDQIKFNSILILSIVFVYVFFA